MSIIIIYILNAMETFYKKIKATNTTDKKCTGVVCIFE